VAKGSVLTNLIAHDNEEYGIVTVYLRLKTMVPLPRSAHSAAAAASRILTGRLRYLERAPAENGRPRGTLVLLHGFPLDARSWEAQLTLADHGWRVIAPDFRGFGAGGAADPPASSVDDYAGDVIDLLTH